MAKQSMAHGSKKWQGHAKRIVRDGVNAANQSFVDHNIGLRLRVVKVGKPSKPSTVRVDHVVAVELQELLNDLAFLDAS
jgi:hypothetical protein